MARAVTRDFERVLFNIRAPEMMAYWMEQDWTGYERFPIGPEGFVLVTRNPEDIQRMKAVYEWENGEFDTGIDSTFRDFPGIIL